MKTLLKIIPIISLAFILQGCFSTNHIGVNTVKSYEGRYTSSNEIVIDGQKIDIEKDSVVWVMRGETLTVLLSTAANQHIGKAEVINAK